MLGPSFILLGLGLGSGELILWPGLVSQYGLGIIWGALLGITFQFFINMEIERYTLITGESIFAGFYRILKRFSPLWFIFSTLIPWMWPGIIASSGLIFANILGVSYTSLIPIILFIFSSVILTLGPVIYKMQEIFQKTLLLIGVPFILFLVFIMSEKSGFIELARGLFGQGDGYSFIPLGISFATLLGAFAYSGAGGNLNLTQSFYNSIQEHSAIHCGDELNADMSSSFGGIPRSLERGGCHNKEKGYGMGKHFGKLTSILTGKKEKIEIFGRPFSDTTENRKLYKIWWKRINIEHFAIFWLTGLLTILSLALLAFTTAYGKNNLNEGISFIFVESSLISQNFMPFLGISFLVVCTLFLFSTQFSVLDATSRIMSENLVIFSPKKFNPQKLRIYYYIFLWVQILMGIVIFSLGMTEPFKLVVTGAILNAFAMFFYSGFLLWLNNTKLNKTLRPSLIRNVFVVCAFIFYGVFSFITITKIL